MPPEKTDLITKEELEDICQANDIAFLGLFGSYARGDYGPNSDIDLIVRFSKPKSLLDLVRIEREFSQRLGKPVDLLAEGDISPYLRDRIMAELRPVYEDSIVTLWSAQDLKPGLNLESFMRRRDDTVYLRHISDAIPWIEEYLRGIDKEAFETNHLLQNGIIRQLQIIGEAISHISPQLREMHPHVPWSDIVSMRQRIVHDYPGINVSLVWSVATDDIPKLKEQIQKLLAEPGPTWHHTNEGTYMGTFHYPTEVGTPDGSTYERIEPLVDTGASHTVLPASLLTRLGVSRDERWPFTRADDSIVEMDIHTQVHIDGRSVTTIVVFGDNMAESLLGAYTLDGLKLRVYPVRRRLIPVPGLLK